MSRLAEIVRTGPIESRIGRAILSIVEPDLGREREFNRWYEDDHAIVSALGCPWVFAGQRWIAPRRLRELRWPQESAVVSPIETGCFMAAYWIIDGRYEEFLDWVRPLVVDRLMPVGRMSPPRRHVFTNDQRYLGAAYRDEGGPRDVHALAYPFQGLVVQVIDAGSAADKARLVQWLLDEHLPRALDGSTAMMALLFESTVPPKPKPGADWYERRLTLLWFIEEAPDACLESLFRPQDATIAATGLGQVELVAPFLPVLPGTDRYVDELR